MDTTNSTLRVERDGSAAIVTMTRAARRNALSLEAMRELDGAIAELGRDASVRSIVIAAEGPAFSAGHDLRELLASEEAQLESIFAACVALMETLRSVPQPVIAEIAGLATAAGCQLVAAADLAVAADTAAFATPGVRVGLFCSTPMVPLVRAIGRKRAMEMLLTGDAISAATAVSWGLVNRVVPHGELRQTTLALCARVAQASGEVVSLGKAAFYRQVDSPENEAYERMASVMVQNAQLPDAREGMTAFVEKRPPIWRRNLDVRVL